MTRRAVSLLQVLVIIAACAPRPPVNAPPRVVPASAADSARRLAAALVTREGLPGLAVTVSIGLGGNVGVWHEGFGFADLPGGVPVTPETQFRIGSVSKLLTATALARLVQTGRLNLDAPISKYMTGLPERLRPITLRQLAGHQGGIRHYRRGNEFLSDTPYPTLRDAMTVYASDTLVGAPGTRYFYSSYGFNLIGAVLEEVTGQPFPDVIRRQVAEPLGLSSTVPDRKGAVIPRRARTYSITGTSVAGAPEDDLSGRWPSGGYLSSTDDLARLGRAMLLPGLLSAESLRLMTTPQRLASGEETAVGIGWRVGMDSAGRRYLHHGGTSNGGAAFLLVYPAERLVVALATNAFAKAGEREALAIAAAFLGTPR